MIPVDQTTFGVGTGPAAGNCRAAAMASVLEVPVAAVPNFDGDPDEDWNLRMYDWWLRRGVCLVELEAETVEEAYGYTIANGKDRNGHPHSVVYRAGELVHDPNPHNDRAGLVSVRSHWVLVLSDVAAFLAWRREVAEALYFTAAAGT